MSSASPLITSNHNEQLNQVFDPLIRQTQKTIRTHEAQRNAHDLATRAKVAFEQALTDLEEANQRSNRLHDMNTRLLTGSQSTQGETSSLQSVQEDLQRANRELEQLRFNLQEKQKELDATASDLSRLSAENNITLREVEKERDTAQTNLTQARQDLAQAQQDLANMEKLLEGPSKDAEQKPTQTDPNDAKQRLNDLTNDYARFRRNVYRTSTVALFTLTSFVVAATQYPEILTTLGLRDECKSTGWGIF